jgi:hypothetical protein
MSTTLTAATMTVTVTEAISLNGKDQGATNSFTIASINEVYKQIVTATTTATTFLKFGTAASAGTLIRADVSYLRITNLDDTNFVTIGLSDDGADTAYIKLEKKQSIIIGGTDEGPQVDIHATAGAFAAWADVDSLILDADTASCDVEIFAAMT